MIRPAPLLTIAPSYSIQSIEAGGDGAEPPCGYLSQARWACFYMLGGCSSGRTSENSVYANFGELCKVEIQLRRIPISRSSPTASCIAPVLYSRLSYV